MSEVEAILGPGTEQQSADASFGGFSLNYKNIIWQSKDDDQIITITFSNDKVQAKAQFGL